jgi:phosphatidylinositol glycan class K
MPLYSFVSLCFVFFISSSLAHQVTEMSKHSDNWAVIVDGSNFYFNYRHEGNALGMYNILRQNGFPDSHIILMISEDFSNNQRNLLPGTILFDPSTRADFFSADIEVDYKGAEVHEESLMRVLTGNHPEGTPLSQRMMSNENSNVLVYITGHGGENFIKFRDKSALTAQDLATAVEVMRAKKRFKSLFFIADTCQASTLCELVKTPNFFSISSSAITESSYATNYLSSVQTNLGDRFSYQLYKFLQTQLYTPNGTLGAFFEHLDPKVLDAHPVLRLDLLRERNPHRIWLDDFFVFRNHYRKLSG